jgi:hypothetical protein
MEYTKDRLEHEVKELRDEIKKLVTKFRFGAVACYVVGFLIGFIVGAALL